MPYIILGAEKRGDKILLKSAPFVSEFKFTKPTEGSASLVFTDYSFIKFGLMSTTVSIITKKDTQTMYLDTNRY